MVCILSHYKNLCAYLIISYLFAAHDYIITDTQIEKALDKLARVKEVTPQ